MDDRTRQEILRLQIIGSPYHMRMAADRILAVTAITDEDRAELLQSVDSWLQTYRTVEEHQEDLKHMVHPVIERLRTELAGPAEEESNCACEDLGELFDSEIKTLVMGMPPFPSPDE